MKRNRKTRQISKKYYEDNKNRKKKEYMKKYLQEYQKINPAMC